MPRGFVERFGDSLPRNVLVKTMDGEEFRITFSQVDGSFSGMHRLLMKLSAKQLQFIIFKFFGGPKFEVYLLDTNHIMHATPGIFVFFFCVFSFRCKFIVNPCWILQLQECICLLNASLLKWCTKFLVAGHLWLDNFFVGESIFSVIS